MVPIKYYENIRWSQSKIVKLQINDGNQQYLFGFIPIISCLLIQTFFFSEEFLIIFFYMGNFIDVHQAQNSYIIWFIRNDD